MMIINITRSSKYCTPTILHTHISIGVPAIQLVLVGLWTPVVIQFDGSPQSLSWWRAPFQDLLGPVHSQIPMHFTRSHHLQLRKGSKKAFYRTHLKTYHEATSLTNPQSKHNRVISVNSSTILGLVVHQTENW